MRQVVSWCPPRACVRRGKATCWTLRAKALAKQASYSVAPNDRKRSRILSWGALGGISLLAVAALVLVFPKSDLMTLLRDESNKGNRDLSIAYLRNIIRTEPKDLGFRLLLV